MMCSDEVPPDDNYKCSDIPNVWTVSFVQCDLCTHIWLGAFHVITARLECPNCNFMVTYQFKTADEYQEWRNKI